MLDIIFSTEQIQKGTHQQQLLHLQDLMQTIKALKCMDKANIGVRGGQMARVICPRQWEEKLLCRQHGIRLK